MKKLLLLLVTGMLLLTSCEKVESEGGKIISADEAEKLFGAVKFSQEVPAAEFSKMMDVADSTMMFALKKGLVVAVDSRKVIYPDSVKLNDNDTLTVYSLLKVQELFRAYKGKIITVEQRDQKLTISNGNKVLEYGAICPPYCGGWQ